MKKTILIMAIMLGALVTIAGPWVPISVNTNTWECKPSGATFTNYWNNIGTISTTPTPPTTPTNTPPISVLSPYYTAILWYDFVVDNGTNAAVVDASGSGNNAIKSGGLYNQPVWENYSLKCEIALGDNGFETVNDIILNGANAYTASLWCRLDSTPVVADYTPIFVASTTVGAVGMYRANPIAATNFVFFSGGSETPDNTTNALTVGVWQHLVITRKSTDKFETWVDGVKQSSLTASATPQYVNSTFVFAEGIDATYDDVALWSRVLSGTEITNIYNNARSTNALWYSETEW